MRIKGKVSINVNDIIGKRLGKLEVIAYAIKGYDYTKGGPRMRHYYWIKCDCGNKKVVRRDHLVSNKIHSCGCERGRRHGY